MSDHEEQIPANREIDMTSLKALAHPLRVALLDALSTFGAATASGLGERLGESSGATSYHLRQLAKHGFVREVEDRGSARERWWERVPGGISLPSTSAAGDSASARAATEMVANEWERSRGALLADFVRRGDAVLPPEWRDQAMLTTTNLRLTPEQLVEVNDAMTAVLHDFVTRFRGRDDPGSRRVQLHYNGFPVLDTRLE